MLPFFYIAIGFIVLLGLIAIIWRFSSLRSSIPCPTWLSWLVELDNPFFKNYSAHAIIQHYFQSRASVIRMANSVGFVEKDFIGNRISFTINFEKPLAMPASDELN